MRKKIAAFTIALVLAVSVPTIKAQSGGGGGGGWYEGPDGVCEDILCGIDPMDLMNCNNSIQRFFSWLFNIPCIPY